MKTYQEAERVLCGRPSHTMRGLRATVLRRIDQEAIGLYYHSTPVVVYFKSGDCRLTTDGHRTATTKSRLNEFSPARIYQERWEWYVNLGDGQRMKFYDDLLLDPRGRPYLPPQQRWHHYCRECQTEVDVDGYCPNHPDAIIDSARETV